MISIISNIEEFKKIQNEWDKLVFSTEEPNPFIQSRFIINWWNIFNKNKKLFILFDNNDENQYGMPLYQYRSASFGFRKILRFIGDGAANYSESFSANHAIDQLALNYICEKGIPDIIRFNRVRESSHLYEGIKNFHSEKYCSRLNEIGCTYYIDDIKRKEDYINQLPKKLRYHIRKGINLGNEKNELYLEEAHSLPALENYINQFIFFELENFKTKGKRNSFENKENQLFFKKLLSDLFTNNLLDCFVLRFQNDYLAIYFGYKTSNTIHYILTAYNGKYSEMSPGHLLIYYLLDQLVQQNKKRLDLHYGKNVLYKKQWANNSERIFEGFIYRKNLFNKLLIQIREKNHDSQ